MYKLKLLFALTLLFCSLTLRAQTFARGADVSWCTEMENDGKMFYDNTGKQTELMQLLRQIGMNAVRLRVWMNPENAYGPWCNKSDVLVKARRAHAQGLDLMIDFHYSDFFADPSRQNKPAAWAGMTLEQLKQAVAAHTTDVLQTLKNEGITPRWVQVGNETRTGMIHPEGKLDWSKSGAAAWNGYVTLSNAGYDAVKTVFPDAVVIVHIDRGPEDNLWFFRDFKQYGGKFDMMGLSHYPDYDKWQANNTSTASRITTLYNQFKVPVMIVETGYDSYYEDLAYNVMADLFSKVENLTGCAGVFYWEPEVYNKWKPAYYGTLNWNAYNMGAFTKRGRPGKALTPFYDETAGISHTAADLTAPANGRAYDPLGRPVGPRQTKGFRFSKGRKMLVGQHK